MQNILIFLTWLISLPAAEWLPTLIAEARPVLGVPMKISQLKNTDNRRIRLWGCMCVVQGMLTHACKVHL